MRPSRLREVRKGESLIAYTVSNVGKYYNNTFLNYLLRPLTRRGSLVTVRDGDVVDVFQKMVARICARRGGVAGEGRGELDELGLRQLIEEAIRGMGELEAGAERKCVEGLWAGRDVWLDNYRALKKAVLSRRVLPREG